MKLVTRKLLVPLSDEMARITGQMSLAVKSATIGMRNEVTDVVYVRVNDTIWITMLGCLRNTAKERDR